MPCKGGKQEASEYGVRHEDLGIAVHSSVVAGEAGEQVNAQDPARGRHKAIVVQVHHDDRLRLLVDLPHQGFVGPDVHQCDAPVLGPTSEVFSGGEGLQRGVQELASGCTLLGSDEASVCKVAALHAERVGLEEDKDVLPPCHIVSQYAQHALCVAAQAMQEHLLGDGRVLEELRQLHCIHREAVVDVRGAARLQQGRVTAVVRISRLPTELHTDVLVTTLVWALSNLAQDRLAIRGCDGERGVRDVQDSHVLWERDVEPDGEALKTLVSIGGAHSRRHMP